MIVYSFFGPCRLTMKKEYLSSPELREFSYGLLFTFTDLGDQIYKKEPPLESSLEFSDSQNYENIVDHSLIQDHKIHESVLYQAFFCLFFELSKNECGREFYFLHSLNLYKKEGKGSSFTFFYIMASSLVSLNKAPVLSLSTVGS